MRSCTLRYFCRSKLLSSWLSWWSVKAVRALRGFFVRTGGLSLLLEISRSPSSLVPEWRQWRRSWCLKKITQKNYNYLCTLCIQFFDCVSDCAKLSPTTPFERERARTGIGRAELFVTKVFLFPSENETSVNQSVSICSRFQSTVIPPPGRTIISLIDPPGRPHARGESPGLHLFSHPLHKYSVLKQRT